MSDKTKKSVKRRPRAIAARDLMSVTGGAGVGSLPDMTVGMMPQGPRFPRPGGPGGPTIGFNPQGPTIGYLPTGPRNPFDK
jgi:hypothetical protein